jgi:spermidine synthase
MGLAAKIVVAAVVLGFRQPGDPWHADLKAFQYPLPNHSLSDVLPAELGTVLDKAQDEAWKEAAKYMEMGATTIFEKETPYHHVAVYQEGPVRKLIFGKPGFRGPQNIVDMRDLAYHSAEYTMLTFAAMLYEPRPKRICVIGVGGAVIPRAIELCLPGAEIDAVEIDPTVLKIAQEYFYWRPSRNVHVYTQDGRSFLSWCLVNKKPKYDWIILDAYSDDYVPFHLTTVEFFGIARRMLAQDGVLASNLGVDDALYGCEARTFHAIFGNVASFIGHRSGNVILVAQNGRATPFTLDEAAEAAKRIKLSPETRVDIRHIVSCLAEHPTYETTGPVLSDHWSPVEVLIK